MKIFGIVAQWLFVLCLPVMLITASVAWAMNSQWLYRYGFEKYNVSQVTGLAPSGLEKAAEGLIDYFNSREETISLTLIKDNEPFELFKEREVGHLRDVKGLFQLVYALLLGSLLYGIIFIGLSFFWWRERRLLRGLFYGGCLTLGLMVALGIGILLDFDRLFLEFHLFSFANDLWMLTPATDYLIMLFPQGFWYDAAVFCTIVTVVMAVVLGGVGWWFKKTG